MTVKRTQIEIINLGGTFSMFPNQKNRLIPEKNKMLPLIIDKLGDYSLINEITSKEHEFSVKLENKDEIHFNYYEHENFIDSAESDLSETSFLFDKIKSSCLDNFIVIMGTDALSNLSSTLTLMFYYNKIYNKRVFFVGSNVPISIKDEEFSNFVHSVLLIKHLEENRKSLVENRKLCDVFMAYKNVLHFCLNSCKNWGDNTKFYSENARKLLKLTKKEKIESLYGVYNSIKPFKTDKTALNLVNAANVRKKVGIFFFYPGNYQIKLSNLEKFDSLIILTYGSGCLPSQDKELIERLRCFTGQIILMTQSNNSCVNSSYESAKAFLNKFEEGKFLTFKYLKVPGALSFLYFV